MAILIASPLGHPINPETKYAGMEKLAYQYACELSKNHSVTIMAHKESIFPEGIQVLRTEPEGDPFVSSEVKQYQSWHYKIRGFDVIHDFTHQHYIARMNPAMPILSPFWHAPALAQYPKAPYNVIALSKWAAREFKRVYRQEARYQQTIVVDPVMYHPSGERTDRFLALGIMSPQKGNYEAAMLCKQLGVPLDIAGQAVEGHEEYEAAVKALCDGEQLVYHGEITDEEKIRLLQTCRALIYITPDAYTEVTSHKIQEAMFCGAPIITTPLGAMPEIVTHGVDGFLCADETSFQEAIRNVDSLNPSQTLEQTVRKFGLEYVVSDYVDLYTEVANGLRW